MLLCYGSSEMLIWPTRSDKGIEEEKEEAGEEGAEDDDADDCEDKCIELGAEVVEEEEDGG